MMIVVILSKTAKSGDVLEKTAKYLFGVGFSPASESGPLAHPAVHRVVARGFTDEELAASARPVSVLDAFRSLCAALEPVVKGAPAVEVWVDEADLTRLNPLAETGVWAWEAVLAAVILAFPDVRWRVGFPRGESACSTDEKAEFSRVAAHLRMSSAGDDTVCGLFDGDGLRDWIRGRTVRTKTTDTSTPPPLEYLPRRTSAAAALDEETAYSYFHAYAAYRCGFRATAITSLAGANGRLSAGSSCAPPDLVFEDVYLNFADGPAGMSDLKERSANWRLIEKAKRRVFVTAGQELTQDKSRRSRNRQYIEGLTKGGVFVRTVYKPHAGIWDFYRQSGLADDLRWTEKPGPPAKTWRAKIGRRLFGHQGKIHRGVAEGFVSVPKGGELRPEDHSCPGMLLVISEKLSSRAETLLPDVRSVEDAVRGAVLATDALELLGGRTPTAYVEALRLKHHFEVLAECQFSGVEYHVRLSERFDELTRHAKFAAQWFQPKKQKSAAKNAEIYALGSLVKVFRDHDQFEEEQACQNRIRFLHNRLWMSQGWWLVRLAKLPMFPILCYLELILKSFPSFCFILVVWLVLLTFAFNAAAKHDSYWFGASDAVSSFFSVGPPVHPEIAPQAADEPPPEKPPNAPTPQDGDADRTKATKPAPQDPAKDWPFIAVTCGSIVCGFLHVGVFITHLYTIVRRK